MPVFHRRFHTAAPVSDFVSPRFPPLHHSRHDDTLLLSSCASLHRRRPLQPGFLNTYHLRQPPRKMKDLRAGASRGPYVGCTPGGGGGGGICSCQHVSESRSNQGGDRRTPRLRTRFNSGCGSTEASSGRRRLGESAEIRVQMFVSALTLAAYRQQIVSRQH